MPRVSLAQALHHFCISLLLCSAFTLRAQPGSPSHAEHLEIIVTPTEAEASAILAQLNAGKDFAILAKEKSIDPTATDGGYMGKLDPTQLRAELQKALQGRSAGQLTDIVAISSGYAILKVLPKAPQLEDLNPKRISSLVTSSAIHYGSSVSGLVEANAVIQDYPHEADWDRNFRTVCDVREKSLASAEDYIRRALGPDPQAAKGQTLEMNGINAHSLLAQLYGFSGQMTNAIDEWKATLKIAESTAPGLVPGIEESLGAAYLHYSEMENGAYRNSLDLDFFPPLHPHASYAYKDESKQAIQYFTRYLEQRPNDLEVKWLLNLSYMTLGEYPLGVPAAYRIPELDFHSKESIGVFHDVAPAAGLNIVRQAGGVIVDDFDSDGLLDIVVSSNNVCDPLHYLHNDGDGKFSDRSEQAGLLGQLGGLNIVQADYNNDGCMDILVLRGGWEFAQRKSLLRNNCNGTFTDVTEASGLANTITSTQAAVWADIDNDGLLDLFVGNELSPAQLYHNKGDGTFEEIGVAAGIAQTSFNKGVTAADYDHDGFVDFYVTNNNGVNLLYHNNGNNTFTEIARQAGVQAPTFSFATWFFDYDNDGWPDLYVDGYLTAIDETLNTYVGLPHQAETLKLYRNKHDGTFEDVSAKVGLDKVFMPMGANFGDLDNDGFLDIYLGSGQPSFTALLPHVLLHNKEGKSFIDITQSSGTGELHKGHGIAFADLSRQGHEDIVAEIGGAVPSDAHAMRVFENPGNGNDWINLHLVGVKTNRSAVGALIHLTVQDGASAPRSIYRTVGETSSFGANPLELHIGLGHSARILALDIAWPVSGTQQHFTSVEKNQYLEVKEFETNYTKLVRHPFRFGGETRPADAVTAQATGK